MNNIRLNLMVIMLMSGLVVLSFFPHTANAVNRTDCLMLNDRVQHMVSLLMKMPPEVRRTLFTGDKLNGLCEIFVELNISNIDLCQAIG